MGENFRDKTLQEVFFNTSPSGDLREKELKEALYKNATGYDYENRVIETGKDGIVKVTRTERLHIPSESQVAISILALMRNGRW